MLGPPIMGASSPLLWVLVAVLTLGYPCHGATTPPCVGRSAFEAGKGGCPTYAVDGINRDSCETDGAEAACSECGACVDGAPWPPSSHPPPPVPALRASGRALSGAGDAAESPQLSISERRLSEGCVDTDGGAAGDGER